MFAFQSIRGKIVFAVAVAISLLLVLLLANLYSVRQGTAALALVYEQQVEPAAALERIDRDLKEVRFRMAGVLLDQLPYVGSRNHLQEVRARVPEAWQQFRTQTADAQFPEEARAAIAKIDQHLADLPVFLDQLSQAYAQENKPRISALLEDDWPLIQAGILKPISVLLPEQQAAVKRAYEKSLEQGQRLIYTGVLIFLFSAIILTLIIGRTMQGITRGVKAINSGLSEMAKGNFNIRVDFTSQDEFGEMARALEATVTQIRRVIEGVQEHADQAAHAAAALSQRLANVVNGSEAGNARIMETAAALEKIASGNAHVAQSASEAADAVHENEEHARESDVGMRGNIEATEKVVASVGESACIIARLNDSIQRIGHSATVIKEIADQTNLLALNAAIEAARAGEQGRGFAVVADEVRKLAERTGASTGEIAQVIDIIRKETSAAVAAMETVKQAVSEGDACSRSAGEMLKQIVEAARRATTRVSEIAEAVKEQSAATDNVARNMDEVSAVSGDNAVHLREAEAAAREVSRIASELDELVQRFHIR